MASSLRLAWSTHRKSICLEWMLPRASAGTQTIRSFLQGKFPIMVLNARKRNRKRILLPLKRETSFK